MQVNIIISVLQLTLFCPFPCEDVIDLPRCWKECTFTQVLCLLCYFEGLVL